MRNRVMKTFALAGVALMLVLAGCGDDDDSSEGSSESVELPAEAADVLAAYSQATAVDHDGDAMLAVVTEDFTFHSDSVGDTVLDRDGYAAEVNRYGPNVTVENLGDDVVVGDADTYIVSTPQTASGAALGSTGFSVIRVVESDGEWLVDAHRFTGDFHTR